MIELLPLPDWMDDAACRGADNNLFFVEQGGSAEALQAKQICAGCPVRETCLEWALETNQDHGIWGGLGTKARRALIPIKEKPKGDGSCSIEGCERTSQYTIKGWCNMHYLRNRRHGSPYWEPAPPKVTTERLEKMAHLSHREVAHRLGVTADTVKKARARRGM